MMRRIFAAVVVGVMEALAYAGVIGISKEIPMIVPFIAYIHALLLVSSAWIMGELLWK